MFISAKASSIAVATSASLRLFMPAKASSIAEDTSSGLADSGKLPIAVSIISCTSSAVSGSSVINAGSSAPSNKGG